uniref:PHB depolymerase family esterase n=1 Tax=Acidicaldus sp. TaxID=1872105 RepID=A0A8J4HB23_9PROT
MFLDNVIDSLAVPRQALSGLRRGFQRRWRRQVGGLLMPLDGAVETGLTEITDFGSNPGRLRMHVFRPASAMRPGAPLVMVLHGCGQEAAAFATSAGWIEAATRHGWVLLLPEQDTANNHARCFNWYRPDDARRGRGEVLSLRQMVATALRRFACDRRGCFVVGLSAGGAMAAALLAAYPETFAAGAVVAGLPVGCAESAGQAYLRMQNAGPEATPEAWASLITDHLDHAGPWPRLSIWHGLADQVVDPANGENLARQWTALHGMAGEAGTLEAPASGVARQHWGQRSHPAVEAWWLENLDHGFPIGAPASAARPASQWVHPAAMDATSTIARFWEIA